MTRPPKRKRLTPHQKKALSYARDCRNDFGQNDKASRKAIPRNKATEHRAARRVAKARLRHDPENAPLRVKRGWWRKFPDLPLGADLESRHHGNSRPHTPALMGKSHDTPPERRKARKIRSRVKAVLKGQG